jgi:hypothetical protein
MLHDRVEWIEYKGKQLLYCDYRNLYDDDVIRLIKIVDEVVLSSERKDLLKINDVRGQFATSAILPEIKRSSKLQKPYLKKSAYVGITGVKKILLDAINRVSNIGAKPFTDIETAKEWLVQD